MKKVLFVATITKHITTFHLPYLKMFKEHGYEVHVATDDDAQIPYCDVHHKISIRRNPFKIDNLKAIKQLKKIINEEKFDIVHCHTPMGSVVARLAAKEARKNGTRVIYTAHGFHFYKGAPLVNWLMFYPVEWYLAKYTDTLITINKEDFNRAKKKFEKRCKDIQYVPGVGLETKKFDITMTEEEKMKYRESLGLKKDDFVLICVARLDKNKNQRFLIKCMRDLVNKHQDIHLILAGKDELNGKYQKMAEKMNVANNVHFLGNRNDVSRLLMISSIAVSVSLREGLGMNLIEALYSNKPVIASNNRGHRDIIINDYNGYLIENNDFEEKIEYLYDKRDRLMELSMVGKKSVNIFCVNNVLDNMENIYFG